MLRARFHAARAAPDRGRAIAIAIALSALLAAFWIGRASAPSRTAEDAAASVESACPQTTPIAAAATSSSGAACCPCPKPRAPRVPSLVKKSSPPVDTPNLPPRDPTADTARYLRESAPRFSPCAPKDGAAIRVHLEVTVAPSGAIERSRITNLDPLPPATTSCVETILRELTPPGFDGSASEAFALTLVL